MRSVVTPNSSVMIAAQALGGFKEWPLLEDVDMVQRYAPPQGEGRGFMAHWCMQRCTSHCCIEGRGMVQRCPAAPSIGGKQEGSTAMLMHWFLLD